MNSGHNKTQDPIYDEYGMTQWRWIVRYKNNFVLGKNTEIGSFTIIDARKGVTIEDDVKIGWSTVIISYSSIDNKEGEIVLKRKCSVGANSIIMPGITVGENSIVGANSLVNKNIPPNEMWFGSPARFIKKL